MRKFLTILVFCVFSFSNAFTTELWEYVSDSGRNFYFMKYGDKGSLTTEETSFLHKQNVYVKFETYDETISDDEMFEYVNKIFKDSIEELYKKNKDYMWENFPDYRYSFDEVYSLLVKPISSSLLSVNYDKQGNKYRSICRSLNLLSHLSVYTGLEKLERYPYILGYLYKVEKPNNITPKGIRFHD